LGPVSVDLNGEPAVPMCSRQPRPERDGDAGVGGPPVGCARTVAERGPALGGTPDPRVPPDDRGHCVAAAEWSQVARDPGRVGTLVDGGADLHPLGAAGGVGAPASAGAGGAWAPTG